MKKYTQILRDLREDNDLKQSDIAVILKTTQQHYSQYETGEHEIPLRVLMTLADYYHVSLDYLTGRTDCDQGLEGLGVPVAPGYTAGQLVTDVLSLSPEGRQYVLTSLQLQLRAQKK